MNTQEDAPEADEEQAVLVLGVVDALRRVADLTERAWDEDGGTATHISVRKVMDAVMLELAVELERDEQVEVEPDGAHTPGFRTITVTHREDGSAQEPQTVMVKVFKGE